MQQLPTPEIGHATSTQAQRQQASRSAAADMATAREWVADRARSRVLAALVQQIIGEPRNAKQLEANLQSVCQCFEVLRSSGARIRCDAALAQLAWALTFHPSTEAARLSKQLKVMLSWGLAIGMQPGEGCNYIGGCCQTPATSFSPHDIIFCLIHLLSVASICVKVEILAHLRSRLLHWLRHCWQPTRVARLPPLCYACQ